MISVCFQGKPFNITVIQIYAPTTNAEEDEVEQFSDDLHDLLELKPKKDALFIRGNWNAKVGNQEIPGVTGMFDLGVHNEAGQRLTGFCKENALVIPNTLSNNTRDNCHEHHQMVKTESRLITFFAAIDQETIKSAKTRWVADVAVIMNSLLQI